MSGIVVVLNFLIKKMILAVKIFLDKVQDLCSVLLTAMTFHVVMGSW